jgi:DNA-binding beta-propeller fold protein YncE
MRMNPLSPWWLLLATPLAACGSSKDKAPLPAPDDFIESIRQTPPCVLECNPACVEAATPWVCPALADWNDIPHDSACGSFDGKTFPAVVPGACVATDPAGEAVAKTSLTARPVILPDGRRLAPAGTEWVFDEADLGGGFPASVLLLPGTKWLVVSDDGYLTHALRMVDTSILRVGSASPVSSLVKFPAPQALNYGLAYRDASKTLYAAGGSPESKIYAFTVDVGAGTATRNPAKDIALPKGAIAQGIAISPSGKVLLVGQASDTKMLIFSVDDADHGTAIGQFDVGAKDVFAVRFDPNDAAGNTAYATMWTAAVDATDTRKMRLLQIDVAKKATTTIAVGKTPEELAFLDARYAVIANSLSDSISILDRAAGAVVGEVPVAEKGAGPTAILYDPPRKRLYTTLSSTNGVAVFDVDLTGAAPTLTPAGIMPSAWWPTGLAVDPADGTVFVSNGKGHGGGTDKKAPQNFSDGSVGDRMRGSVQAIPFMDAAALTAATSAYDAQNKVGEIAGYSKVECKGAPYDFPIPPKIEDGPSTKIKHMILIVRENKTFDDIFGDVPGLDGDPNLVMAPGHMEEIWGNARAIGKAFAHMDNYYEDAEQSIQGHAWTVFGRSTDYTERRWLVTWGRGEFGVTSSPGVGGDTTPLEGTIFSSLVDQHVSIDNMGELIGGLSMRDPRWPGGSTDATIPDTLGACYVAARARVLCNPKDFTYVWLTNDHGFGLSAGKPNPALMISTNDEGTGMLLDGVSHSPMWPETLVVVVEDDPNTGDDHVDLHRTIALFASPWVKRNYVSHGHYDIASVHKLISHVFGKPYRNATIANAALPLDLFTSTPDYTPFNHKPRIYKDLSCNPAGTTGAKAAENWDFSEPDDQPGLDKQTWETLRHLPASKK